MAKTTTTQAKTKTSKKSPSKKKAVTTKKAPTKVNAKTTTKSVATKTKKPIKKTVSKVSSTAKIITPTKTAEAKVSRSRTRGGVAFFNRGQVLYGGVFAALAVMAGLFMNNTSTQVLVGHLTKDELASRVGTVLAPAAHVLYQIEFRWLLVALLGVTAVIAILRGTRYNTREENGIKVRSQPARWVEFGITGAIAFEIAALLNGLQDVMAIKLGAVSILVAAYLCWVYERENAATGKPARAIYSASAVAVLIPVLALAATMYSNYVYGMVRSPWYAYAAAAVVSISLLWTVRMQSSVVAKRNSTADYYFVNRNYDRLAVVSKVALAAILITGLYK